MARFADAWANVDEARHPRMVVAVKAWQARDPVEQAAVRSRADELCEQLP